MNGAPRQRAAAIHVAGARPVRGSGSRRPSRRRPRPAARSASRTRRARRAAPGCPSPPCPEAEVLPTETRSAPSRSISTSSMNSSGSARRTPGRTGSRPVPRRRAPSIRSRLHRDRAISFGAASGWITVSGCGSKVSTVSAWSITAWWPRWTPSKVPIATWRARLRSLVTSDAHLGIFIGVEDAADGPPAPHRVLLPVPIARAAHRRSLADGSTAPRGLGAGLLLSFRASPARARRQEASASSTRNRSARRRRGRTRRSRCAAARRSRRRRASRSGCARRYRPSTRSRTRASLLGPSRAARRGGPRPRARASLGDLAAVGLRVQPLAADLHGRGHAAPAGASSRWAARSSHRHPAGLGQLALGVAGARAPAEPAPSPGRSSGGPSGSAAARVARPSRTSSRPVANGSRVPACPALSRAAARGAPRRRRRAR